MLLRLILIIGLTLLLAGCFYSIPPHNMGVTPDEWLQITPEQRQLVVDEYVRQLNTNGVPTYEGWDDLSN